MHKVTITMENGKATIKVEGVKGEECETITAEIEKKLGTVTSKQRTSDYYEKTQERNAEH